MMMGAAILGSGLDSGGTIYRIVMIESTTGIWSIGQHPMSLAAI